MERYRKTIFCDWDFLVSYTSMLGEDTPDIDGSFIENNKVANCIFSSDVKLCINAEKGKFEEKLREIEKKRKNAAKKGKEAELTPFEYLLHYIDLEQQNNRLHVHISPLDYEDLSQKDKYLNAMFFTSKSKEACQKAMCDYGVIAMCAENIHEFSNHLYSNGAAVRKSEANKWSTCLALKNPVPCNSLIIVDNYILSNTYFKENLKEIFNTLIPLQLSPEVEFQIAIFTSPSLKDAKSKKQAIDDMLKGLRPEMKFSVTIIKCSSDNFHDRNIISNNILISCGAGFDLFKQGKSQKTTTISLHTPFTTSTNQWTRKAYSDILHDAIKVYNNSPQFGENNIIDSYTNFWLGDKRNRIIDNAT